MASTAASWLSKHPRRSGERQDAGIDAGGLHDAAVEREVAGQHGKAAVLREGMLGVADAAGGAIGVELLEPARSG